MANRPLTKRESLADLYVVMLQSVEVLQPYADRPDIEKHLADAGAICKSLKRQLDDMPI